jgi:quercetin dioxygenase-like cupin family protein
MTNTKTNPTNTPLPTADYLWFFNSLVRRQVCASDGTDGISVLEHRAPYGDSPPLHIHRTEDEIFYILEGDFRFQLGEAQKRAAAGATLLVPKGARHTYRIESRDGGRWLTVTRGGDFERFVVAVSRPAERIELPPPEGPPSPEMFAKLTKVAATHGIEFCGPPLH